MDQEGAHVSEAHGVGDGFDRRERALSSLDRGELSAGRELEREHRSERVHLRRRQCVLRV
jgi:hypothetical protein